jgi:imidazolonepropionase-like amidohydrolase
VIRNTRIINVGDGIAAKEPTDVVISGGRIEAISPRLLIVDAPSLDGRGLYVSPGLIDAHAHFFFDCSADPVQTYLASDAEARIRTATANAAVALAAGITTMRDLGGPRDLMEVFSRRVAHGEISGPHVVSSGAPLTRPGGHCHFFGGEVSSTADVRALIESQIAAGARCVKLMASGGGMTAGTRAYEADFPLEFMQLAREIAHANGVPITAHCHATESMRRSIDAGLDSIEHVSFLEPPGGPRYDKQLAVRLRDAGIVVCPNVANGIRAAQVFRKLGRPYHEGDPFVVERLEARLRFTEQFYRLGVRIIGGSDCGTNDTPFNVLIEEAEAFQSVGFSNAEVLRSVTSECAKQLRLPHTGEVKVGYDADLVLYRDNPLDNLATLGHPQVVVKSGKVVHNFGVSK